jgi:hypothetical protein
MTKPITSLRPSVPAVSVPNSAPQKMIQVFKQSKPVASQFDLSPLRDPFNAIVGAIWVGFWGLSALFSGMSLSELYTALTVESPSLEKNAKIAKAAKTAIIDLTSLGGSTAHTVRFADEVKMISLGQYAPLVKALGYGASIVIGLIDGGWSAYNLGIEVDAISKETIPAQREKHKQQFCLSLIKLIGNVCMVAWSTLGIAMVVTTLVVSPTLMTILLIAGCVFPISAFFYQKHIEQAAQPRVSPA